MRFSTVAAAVALVAGASAYSNSTGPVYVTEVVSSAAPTPVTSLAPTAPYSNGTTPIYTPPAGTGAPSASATGPSATFTGAANKAFAASGAGLAAVFGLAAYVL